MKLPPLATNTTNTNWWIFPSLLEVVNIPPPLPPTRLALVPLLVEVIVCLLVLFACFFCLSICQYSFPLVLSLSPAKMYTLLHSTSILIQICGLERPATTTTKNEYDPWNITFSEWEARQRMLARQTDFFYGLLVFCLSGALPSLSEWQLLAYVLYAHVANASLCFGPCVPSPHF